LSTQEYNHIVRIVGNDIHGEKKMTIGLTQIKGIGYNFATAILDTLKINPNSNIGYLTEPQVQAIEKLITDPSSSNFPIWFLNRRKDVVTGKDLHLLTSDVDFTLRNDIERERITSSWRGYRHMFGLKVRGQRTRCTGRKGGAVGVAKGGKAAPARSSGPEGVAAPTGEGEAAAATSTAATSTAATSTAATSTAAKSTAATPDKKAPSEKKK
jgi:small subunit ribosomal protein S13